MSGTERRVSATEARVHFGELLDGVTTRHDVVFVERAGKEVAVVVSLEDEKSGTRSVTATCVDASFMVRVLDAPRYPSVQQEWDRLVSAGGELIAPTLFAYEVANALHQQQRTGTISAERAADGLRRVLRLPIELHSDARLRSRALEIADEHQLQATYDAHYIALAERFRVPLWTCDRRLAEELAQHPPEVHLVV